MGLRITTWNVNGIRNPFAYQPWRDKRSFQAMFDILEADIVVLQETKIQRKDLSDDMVLVPGWDCYFSLPRHKKGYSGVVIYTRQSTCAPIRAEEGITGHLCPPNSSTAFMDRRDDERIGGYPSLTQLADSSVDAITLDSEGRCIILEFPAFVLVGVYCPASRDETRNDFRMGFIQVLDARCRNLVAIGKRVFLTGDLNISREEMDVANAEASMRKQGLEGIEFVSTPSRRLLNQLLEGGKVSGDRDQGRENCILWDICRGFHPNRRGMYTCWEQKVNARPGNCGARIDYVLCSLDMKGWFCDSNIQEGLMGSDHCPVYAVIKEKVLIDGKEHYVKDLMNPPGMFLNGRRVREYSVAADPQQLSGRLLTEFSGRRNIRDMFSRDSSMSKAQRTVVSKAESQSDSMPAIDGNLSVEQPPVTKDSSQASIKAMAVDNVTHMTPHAQKRSASQAATSESVKRTKFAAPFSSISAGSKGQQSLTAFLKPKNIPAAANDIASEESETTSSTDMPKLASTSAVEDGFGARTPDQGQKQQPPVTSTDKPDGAVPAQAMTEESTPLQSPLPPLASWTLEKVANVHDPVLTRESWSKLFTKPAAPRCESHNEPCISMLTKKQGINLGRSFWMCPRPLGPSGVKEKNSQWRCGTFIWCSDWNTKTARDA